MPTLKCLDPDCAGEWPVKSELAADEECPECGGPSRVLDAYDDDIDEPTSSEPDAGHEGPRIAFARKRAAGILRVAGVKSPPIDVRHLVTAAGLTVRDRATLGKLQARIVGNLIELVASDPEEVKRFSLAHELGHHYLETA